MSATRGRHFSLKESTIRHQTTNTRGRKPTFVQRMWTRIPLEVVSQASRVACQEALQREPGTAQQNCIIEKPGPTHTKETPHVCETVDEISVRSHISSDTKLQKQKKNLMCAENVGEASFGSHISGCQRRLAESSPERAIKGPAKSVS